MRLVVDLIRINTTRQKKIPQVRSLHSLLEEGNFSGNSEKGTSAKQESMKKLKEVEFTIFSG